MDKYKVVDSSRASFCDYKVYKNDQELYDIACLKFSKIMDFEFVDSFGDHYRMKSFGLFFWRRQVFYKNDEEYANYKIDSCEFRKQKLKFKGEKVFLDNEKLFKVNYPMEGLISGQWECEPLDAELEPVVIALLVVSRLSVMGVF